MAAGRGNLPWLAAEPAGVLPQPVGVRLGMTIKTGPPNSGAYQFARSIAMINYSKKLKSIKYDETGRIIEYEFDQRPLTQASAYPPAQSAPQKSFGYQPVQ